MRCDAMLEPDARWATTCSSRAWRKPSAAPSAAANPARQPAKNGRGDDFVSPELLRRHSRTGRPWADPRVLARLEKPLSRRLTPGRAGRPRKGP